MKKKNVVIAAPADKEEKILETMEELMETMEEPAETMEEPVETMEEIAETEDVLPPVTGNDVQKTRKMISEKQKQKKGGRIRNKALSRKNVPEIDARQVKRMLRSLVPYLTALLLLCMIAFGLATVCRISVETYCNRVYEENKRYFSYE